HNLHANAWDELSAPLLAGVNLGDADWTAFLWFAIPMELHPDVAILVGADLFVLLALLADDPGSLDAVDARLRRQRQAAEGAIARVEYECAVIGLGARTDAAAIMLRGKIVRRVNDQVLRVFLRGRVLFNAHEPARMERGRIAVAGAPVVDRLLGLEAVLCVVLAFSLFVVFVMVVVDF